MRIEGFAVVKNEADIIEAFVRHHCGLLDRLHVVDNGSTDRTKDILAALCAEGLPIAVTHDDSPSHPQADIVTAFVAGFADGPDWLFLLDADEFIDCSSRNRLQEILNRQAGDVCHLVRWSFMVPTEDDDRSIDNPVVRIQSRRRGPTDPFLSKLVIPRQYLGAPEYRVVNGSHFMIGVDGVPAGHRELKDLRLAHFPVRSPEQLARKVVVGSWAVLARPSRLPTEVFHWHELRRRVMSGRPLTVADARQVAQNYASSDGWTDHPVAVEPLALAGSGQLRYTPPSDDAWRQYAVEFADSHFRSLAGVVMATGPITIGKTVHGVTAFPVSDAEGRVLAAYGDVAPGLNSVLSSWTRPGDQVVHVGAGLGFRTLIAAHRAGPTGSVIAVAGDERLLPTNLVLRNLTNVQMLGDTEVPTGCAPDLVVWEAAPSGPLLALTTSADRVIIRAADASTGADWVRLLEDSGLAATMLQIDAVPARSFVDTDDVPLAPLPPQMWHVVLAARDAATLAEVAPG